MGADTEETEGTQNPKCSVRVSCGFRFKHPDTKKGVFEAFGENAGEP